MNSFVCSWSAVGECAIVRVSGKVDGRSAAAFETELKHVITTKLPKLVVDLRRLTAMEPAGVNVLVDAHELALKHGGWLRTSGPAEWLADLMQAVKPTHYLSLAEALPAYRPAFRPHG